MIKITNSVFDEAKKTIIIGDWVVDASDGDPQAVRLYELIMEILRDGVQVVASYGSGAGVKIDD